MLYFYSIIFGVVQGITEFLPISSSGHLVILHDILNFNLTQNLAFDVALHLGTGLALVIFFWFDFWKMIQAVYYRIFFAAKVKPEELKLVLNLIFATIPAMILGLLLNDYIENLLRATSVVVITVIVGAVLLLIVEKYGKNNLDLHKLNWRQSLYLGLAESLALVPGLSRSGITMTAGMSLGLSRSSAARFSFLMATPIILGAGVLKIAEVPWLTLGANNLIVFALGFVTAFIVSLAAIKWLLAFVANHSLKVFAYYRFGLALLLIVYLLAK